MNQPEKQNCLPKLNQENNQIIGDSGLTNQDIFGIKIISLVILTIIIGIVYWTTGSLWAFVPYIPAGPYMLWPNE